MFGGSTGPPEPPLDSPQITRACIMSYQISPFLTVHGRTSTFFQLISITVWIIPRQFTFFLNLEKIAKAKIRDSRWRTWNAIWLHMTSYNQQEICHLVQQGYPLNLKQFTVLLQKTPRDGAPSSTASFVPLWWKIYPNCYVDKGLEIIIWKTFSHNSTTLY